MPSCGEADVVQCPDVPVLLRQVLDGEQRSRWRLASGFFTIAQDSAWKLTCLLRTGGLLGLL